MRTECVQQSLSFRDNTLSSLFRLLLFPLFFTWVQSIEYFLIIFGSGLSVITVRLLSGRQGLLCKICCLGPRSRRLYIMWFFDQGQKKKYETEHRQKRRSKVTGGFRPPKSSGSLVSWKVFSQWKKFFSSVLRWYVIPDVTWNGKSKRRCQQQKSNRQMRFLRVKVEIDRWG